MDWKANKYEFNWTTSQKQAKDKWHQPKNLEHKQTNSHRQLALCKAMGWGTRRPWLRRSWMQACAISDLSNDSNDPLWPRLQLVSDGAKCFDSRNVRTKWELIPCSRAGKASTYHKRPVASKMLRWAWAKIARDQIFDLAPMHLLDQLGAV